MCKQLGWRGFATASARYTGVACDSFVSQGVATDVLRVPGGGGAAIPVEGEIYGLTLWNRWALRRLMPLLVTFDDQEIALAKSRLCRRKGRLSGEGIKKA